MAFGGALFPVILYTALVVLSSIITTASSADYCSPSPCLHGVCYSGVNGHYRCVCDQGWAGVDCDHGDSCSPSPCLHGVCYSGVNGHYRCVCDQGWAGVDCDQSALAVWSPATSTASTTDSCSPSPCLHGVCYSGVNGHFRCVCDQGWAGVDCDQSDPCSPSPCLHGLCYLGYNGVYQCVCDQGWAGVDCDQSALAVWSPATSTASTADPCSPSPCLHGVCYSGDNGLYMCVCDQGWAGVDCDQSDLIVGRSLTYTSDGSSGAIIGTGMVTEFGSGSGCVYNGQVYRQGESWQDGCKYSCQCVDGLTGKYQCKAMCLSWDLPTQCHMEPPVSGKCCPTPNCPANINIKYPDGYVSK